MENSKNTLASLAKCALVVCVLGLGLAACQRTEPIYTVENRLVPVQATSPRSSKMIGDATIRAAAAKNWVLDASTPGQYHATTTWRSHTATATITYDEQSYSISLEKSQNLAQADGRIHRAYNRRVQQLEAEIGRQLLLPAK